MIQKYSARKIALHVLLEIEKTAHTKDQVQHEWKNEIEIMDERDRKFYHALISGVLRYRLQLDYHLHHCIRWKVTSDKLKWVLRLAFFELIFHAAKPHAVVNEYVAFGQNQKEKNFTNGVLRGALRNNDWEKKEYDADRCRSVLESIYQKGFPRRLALDSIRYSSPPWLVIELTKSFSEETVQKILASSIAAAEVVVRFGMNVSLSELNGIDAENNHLQQMPWSPRAFKVPLDSTSFLKPYLQTKKAWLQESGSQLVSLFLAPSPDERILDAFAGAGGKTAHLLDLCPSAQVTALEKNPHRILQLRKVMPTPTIVEMDFFDYAPEHQFTKILVDAPCSGLGTLAKNPDLKWRLKKEDIRLLSKIQLAALKRASRWLEAQGTLFYSVCSFLPEETDGVIEKFLEQHPEFSIKPLPPLPPLEPWMPSGMFKVLPGEMDQSGYFICALTRR